MNMKTIVILYNLNHYNFEYEAEFDSELTIRSLQNALCAKYKVFLIEADKKFLWISKLNNIHPDLVFNICEGYAGPARESVYGAILEQLEYNYTGPDSTNLLVCHNKSMVKKILSSYCLVPFGFALRNVEEIELLPQITYPVIVKLNSEGSSIGLNRNSIVWNKNELVNQVRWLQSNYNRNILIEEYIMGQDISMIYIQGIGALGPCVIECDSDFYDYEMKTTKDITVDIHEANGEYSELEEIVLRVVRRLDIKGYAKMDFRLCENKFYLIEVNSQVSFHPQGEFITCAKRNGYEYASVINHIVENALQQHNKVYSLGIGE